MINREKRIRKIMMLLQITKACQKNICRKHKKHKQTFQNEVKEIRRIRKAIQEKYKLELEKSEKNE